jgi:MFS family permease
MGWTSPVVLGLIGGGLAVLAGFCVIETRVAEPMFRLSLFRIRPFTAGNLASLLSSLGRGGLMFILIIWLQGIYLPIHGYSFERTPLWAGIAMLPLTVGFLIAGPASGWLSDRFGARPFATGGMLVAALSFVLLELLPVNFEYWQFALVLLMNGIGMGLFASPNRAGIMNSLPPDRRGVGAGMSATFQNSAMVLSIGIFFTLIILGLASSLPATLSHGLMAQGVPSADAARLAALPPDAPHLSVYQAWGFGDNPELADELGALVVAGGVALLLAAFALISAAIFHNHPSDHTQMIMFWKNVSIAGGFLLLVVHGAGPLSLDARWARR